jgi:hypothetical protein
VSRSVIRVVDWACSPETAPEAPGLLHQFECIMCGERGACSEDFETARGFTFQHVGGQPSHTGYREILHRFWRMHMAD